jgi:protoporphyrinogen oxidase
VGCWMGGRKGAGRVADCVFVGSSAAYFLSHFAGLQGMGLETEVTVFESSDYVGGRSTVIRPWEDDPWATPGAVGDSEDGFEAPIECGASIFVEVGYSHFFVGRVPGGAC